MQFTENIYVLLIITYFNMFNMVLHFIIVEFELFVGNQILID